MFDNILYKDVVEPEISRSSKSGTDIVLVLRVTVVAVGKSAAVGVGVALGIIALMGSLFGVETLV